MLIFHTYKCHVNFFNRMNEWTVCTTTIKPRGDLNIKGAEAKFFGTEFQIIFRKNIPNSTTSNFFNFEVFQLIYSIWLISCVSYLHTQGNIYVCSVIFRSDFMDIYVLTCILTARNKFLVFYFVFFIFYDYFFIYHMFLLLLC